MELFSFCMFMTGVALFAVFWILSENDEETVECNYCHQVVSGKKRVCPHCNRTLNAKCIGWFIGLIIMVWSVVFYIMYYSNTKHIKTSGSYAMYDRTYCFKIDDMTYDGDTYKSGYYTFDIFISSKDRSFPIIYDIYVSDYYFSNEVQVLNHAEHKATVGGLENYPQSFSLNPNQYVYCVPYKRLVYEPQGVLQIKKN